MLGRKSAGYTERLVYVVLMGNEEGTACIVWEIKHFKHDGTVILKILRTAQKAVQHLRSDHPITGEVWAFCLTYLFPRVEDLAHWVDLTSTVCLGREANLEITVVFFKTPVPDDWRGAWEGIFADESTEHETSTRGIGNDTSPVLGPESRCLLSDLQMTGKWDISHLTSFSLRHY